MSLLKIARLGFDIEYQRNYRNATPTTLGRMLTKRLPEMGPTFIKIGQFVSSRDDIFGKELCNELKVLQDSTTPIDVSHVETKLKEIPFEAFNEVPIATASIGQVHEAKLKGNQKVAVKIRRPNIEQTIRDDFDIILQMLDIIKTISDNRRIMELDIVFREYYNMLMDEINFQKEVSNINTFSKNFSNLKWIKVPKVYGEYCNDDIIVMEFVEGTKIDKVPDSFTTEQCKLAIRKIAECFMYQISQYNFVHIDPHPGNVSINDAGQLVFYDYGMVLDISRERIAERFDDFMLYVFQKDADALANLLVETEIFVVLPGNMTLFKSFVKFFLSYTSSMNVNDFKEGYIKQLETVGGMPFFISSKFVMLLRGFAILEGIFKKLDPDFNYQEALTPFVQDRMVSISYLESRVSTDIKSFQELPASVEQTQMMVDILQKNLSQQKTQQTKTNILMMLFIILLTFFK